VVYPRHPQDERAEQTNRVGLEELLAKLPRKELKELCRGLGLDESGKEKRVLVERILGREAEEVAWEDRDSHQFFVPPAARWAKLQEAELLVDPR
jgi:hypothetical protein